MANDKILREQVITLLRGGEAHQDFDTLTKNVSAALRGKRPHGAAHSLWEVLEHLRITQWDILEFTRNPNHKSPEFPAGYWPSTQAPPTEKAWDKTVAAFRADHAAIVELVADEKTDLFAKIPHGDGQTIFRQALLTADHNSYHLGEFLLLRRLLGDWK